jgi:hypothetical protein
LIEFLLLFNVTLIFVPRQWSYCSTILVSSSTLLLLLFYDTPIPPISRTFLLFMFQIGTSPPPRSCFCRYGKNKFSKFNFHSSG